MSSEKASPQPYLKTLRDWVRWGASLFNARDLYFGHGTDNALDESLALVLHAVELDHSLPESFLDTHVTDAEAEKIESLMYRRVDERIPLAYLTGTAAFAGFEFTVTPDVLVPRSPIAELIRAEYQPWANQQSITTLLDLCTGSGCIGIASALMLEDTYVDLVDISPKALEVAKKNIQRHQLDDRVRTFKSDLFSDIGGRRYDIIVSNPPYVSVSEYESLSSEYHQEPRLGLEAGEDGLDIVHRILAEASEHLNPDGILIVEVGSAAEALVAAYPELPFVWIDFEYGGDGVFLLTRNDLIAMGDSSNTTATS